MSRLLRIEVIFMSREDTWKQARERIRNFARAKNPSSLSSVQNPDDLEQTDGSTEPTVESLVAIDNPDDSHVHQPETLGIPRKKPRRKG